MEKEKIHQLAILYFEGKISLEDESVLFQFITENDKNKHMFTSWEKQWMQNQDKDNAFQKDWDSLQSKIQTRKAIAPIFKINRFSTLRKIAAVAAIVIITVASTMITYNLLSRSSENHLFIVETPNGEKSRVILSDGTVVWLNSSSKIKYSSQFGLSERIVELDGEAYFEVKKQDKIPFKVKTRNYDVVVRGTKFNVSSYESDHTITTTLMEGKVEILHEGTILEMAPGESVQMNVETHEFTKSNVHPEQYKSWIDNKIEYDEIALDELFNRLSRQYDVSIHFQSGKKQINQLSISIKNDESIDEILQGISKVIPINIERKGKDIYISLK